MKHRLNIALCVLILTAGAFFMSGSREIDIRDYIPEPQHNARGEEYTEIAELSLATPAPVIPRITPLVKPHEVQGIFVTAWIFSRQDKRTALTRLTDETEINTWVIDIKGNDGVRLFDIMNDERIMAIVDALHKKNIYLIGRITVFQDSKFARSNPEFALKNPEGTLWKDQGRYEWLDPASTGVWEYTLNTAKKAADLGFNEIQLDYIRFPSEGALSHAVYPSYDGTTPKVSVITEFMKYFHDAMREHAPRVALSADIFGYTLLRDNDNGIGQRLLDMLPYFDFISPMVYPSHYYDGNFGYKKPAEYPYEVITRSIEEGLKTLEKQLAKTVPKLTPSPSPLISASPLPPSTTPTTYPCSLLGIAREFCTSRDLVTKLRPWLQDFSLATRYDAEKVRAQIKASEDLGITTWMLWNPNNVYTKDALEAQK